jgi:hypothetical protein
MDASHPEILILYTAIVPAAPQETVRDAGIEPGTAALQSGVTEPPHHPKEPPHHPTIRVMWWLKGDVVAQG